jgi:hypothetical protein
MKLPRISRTIGGKNATATNGKASTLDDTGEKTSAIKRAV